MVCVQERSVSQKPCNKPTTDYNERAILIGWLLKYEEQSDDFLRPHAVLEYSELARVASRSIRDKGFLRNRVNTLCSCVSQTEFLKPKFAVALHKALAHIKCNLIRKYDLKVHDAAGDTVERGWECVGGVEWMPTDPWLEPDGGVLGLWRGLSGFDISADHGPRRAHRRQSSTQTGAGRLGTHRGCRSVQARLALGGVVRS